VSFVQQFPGNFFLALKNPIYLGFRGYRIHDMFIYLGRGRLDLTLNHFKPHFRTTPVIAEYLYNLADVQAQTDKSNASQKPSPI
jgi:hypothetical protein